METIELQQTLPEVFAGRDKGRFTCWKQLRGRVSLLFVVLYMDIGRIIKALFLLMGRISAIYLYHNGCICGKLH